MATEGPTEHYTATIEVTKTKDAYQPKNTRGYDEGSKRERKVQEVTRLVIRANSLEALRQRIIKHVELIEE